jgi:hypothetical protein
VRRPQCLGWSLLCYEKVLLLLLLQLQEGLLGQQ